MAVSKTGTPDDASFATPSSPINTAFDFPSGGDAADAVVIGVAIGNSGDAAEVTGITINGQAMTQVATNVNATLERRVYLFQLVNPPAGNQTVSISFTGSGSVALGFHSFKGVDQGTPVSNFNSANGASATATVDVSSAVGEWTVSVVSGSSAPGSPTQTQFWIRDTGNVDGAGQEATGAASVTHAWTFGGSEEWAIAALSLKAAGGGGVSRKGLHRPGVPHGLAPGLLGGF